LEERRTENHGYCCSKRGFILAWSNGIASHEYAFGDQDADTTNHSTGDESGTADAINDEH
jgi:hypothetical protein